MLLNLTDLAIIYYLNKNLKNVCFNINKTRKIC